MELKEDYVSLEIAKLLKEKGFDEECFKYAINDGIYNKGDYVICSAEDSVVGIPTLQMAMKWLREVHNVCIVPSLRDGEGGFYCFVYTNNYRVVKVLNKRCDTYESACKNAVKRCLTNLI